MIKQLRRARIPNEDISIQKKIFNTLIITLIGLILGFISKWLDNVSWDITIPWQSFLSKLKLGELLSWFSIWFLFSIVIAIHSNSPKRAGLNVAAFLFGMCVSYHWMGNVIYHMNINRYMMIWYIASAVSPILSIICWYAHGTTTTAKIIQAFILFCMALSCSILDQNILNIPIFIITAFILTSKGNYQKEIFIYKTAMTVAVAIAQIPFSLILK